MGLSGSGGSKRVEQGRIKPDRTRPDGALPGRIESERALPDRVKPDCTRPGRIKPDRAAPERAASIWNGPH